MGARRRIRNTGLSVGGGGGTTVGGGTVTWGPEFGGPAPYHPEAGAALDLDNVQFTGQFTALGALDLAGVDLAGQLNPVQVLDLANLDLDGGAGAAGAVATQIALDGTLTSLGAVDLADVDFDGALGTLNVLNRTTVDLAGDLAALGALSLTTVELPRVDNLGDAWIEQASPDTNHGSATDLEVRSDNALGSGEERALLQFDLTTFTGFNVSGDTELVFWAREEALLGSVDLQVRLSSLASQPFDESTVTWNNQPAENIVQTPVQTISDATYQEQRVTISASDMGQFLGNWLYVRFQQNNTVDTPQVFVQSKEVADTARHPRLENLTLVPA